MVGLASSAAAAQVLADDLGISTENTAKWIDAHTRNGWALKASQLMIVDEASLAGTFTLENLASHAAEVGAKLLLVGDWAQLSAVDSGGAFGLIARDLEHAPELFDVRRFHNDWEKESSLGLRLGDLSVIDTYLEHGRIVDGDLQDMLDAAFTAWQTDLAAGEVSVMIAETVETVRALNERARLDRIITGHVSATAAVDLHDETQAGCGDLVITRKNQRKLSTGKGWVKNGDRWIITATHNDGSLTVRRAGIRTSGVVHLPAIYVSEYLELAYAVTAHRAQGSTVDTAHAVVHSSQMTRETFYVAMTRGRDSNTCYVATDQAQLEEHQHFPDDELTAKTVLAGVLLHEGAEKSAHETIAAEYEAWAGIAQLAAEYDTIAVDAQRDRWVALMEHSGLDTKQVALVVESESFGPLMAELRRADANDYNLDILLPRLITARDLGDADDLGAVLRQRLQRATSTRSGSSRGRSAPRFVAGLIPEANGEMKSDMRAALDERKALIEHRAMTIAETATRAGELWTSTLGDAPTAARQRQAWLKQVRIIAAYRDRYGIADLAPLGQESRDANQRLDAARARAALHNAQRLGGASPVATTKRPANRAQQRPQPTP